MHHVFLRTYLMFLLMGLAFLALFNFTMDPFQIYRYNLTRELDPNDRLQVVGFAKNFNYDQVIIGSSMTQNFSLSHIKNKLGTHPIRLSLSGATIQEQALALKTAIKTGKVKSVIWGIDQNYLNYEPQKYSESFPADIYLGNIRGHLQYLISKNIFRDSCRLLKKLFSSPEKHPNNAMLDLENYNSWHKTATYYSKENISKQFNNDVFKADTSNVNITLESLSSIAVDKTMMNNFHRDIVAIVKNNPDIEFTVFLPPYSLAHQKSSFLKDKQSFQQYAKHREYIMKELIQYKNVSLYDFETHLPTISNLTNYRDLTHYSQNINNFMVDSFAHGKQKVTSKNIVLFQKAFLSLLQKDFQ